MRRSQFLKAGAGLFCLGLTSERSLASLGGTARARLKSSATQSLPYPASDYRETVLGRAGGTIRASVAIDTGSLDPHAISATNCEWIGRILFDNLVYLDEHGNATPWLATSWTISPDGKTYRFFLRDDVTFSDGAKFNAEAVLVNLAHMRDPATKSPLAASYIQPYASGRALDEYIVELMLHAPYSPFLNVLAQSFLGLESPKAILDRPKTLGGHPVGSGPFVLESYLPQKGMSFIKRRDYHWAPPLIGHQGPAYLDRMEFEFVPDASVRYFSLASGEYDFTIDAPPQAARAIAADSTLELTSRVRMGCPNRGIAFNVDKFPFDDVNIRRAAALSIDREGIADVVGFGLYRPIANFLAENTPFYDPSFADQLNFNPALANAILDQAGWSARDTDGIRLKDGQRLAATAIVTQSYTSIPMIVEMQADLKKIGFALQLEQIPLSELLQQRNSGQYQAMTAGVWHTNTPDALYINYHSSQIPSHLHGGQNVSRLTDAALDMLLEQARETNDPVLKKTLYAQAQARLVALVPAVPLYDNQSVIAYQSRLQGVVYDTSHETPLFQTVWLESMAA